MPKLTKNQWGWIGATYVVYGLLMGWPLAFALVLAFGFHEYCHLMMAHKLGIKTKGFTMIPFIGGMAYIPFGGYKTLWRQAQVLFAGPIGGFALAIIFYLIFLVTGAPFFAAVAFYMGVLNFFNLLPISFLDGGQLMNCVTYSINRKTGLYIMCISTILGTALICAVGAWLLAIFVLIFSFMHCRREYRNQKYFELGLTWLCTPDFLNKPYPLNKKQIQKVAIIWVSTVVLIVSFCYYLYASGFANLALLRR